MKVRTNIFLARLLSTKRMDSSLDSSQFGQMMRKGKTLPKFRETSLN